MYECVSGEYLTSWGGEVMGKDAWPEASRAGHFSVTATPLPGTVEINSSVAK